MTSNELQVPLDSVNYLHICFGVKYLTFSTYQIYVFITFGIKQGHEIKLQALSNFL